MSETISQATAAPIASLLDALHEQQRAVPEEQRGLAGELADLRGRLAGNAALENDANFCVQVGWLVQDWKQHSGTGSDPQVSPVMAAGLRVMAAELPGLNNADMRALLDQSSGIPDRGLVAELRQRAVEMSQQSPQEQASIAAAKVAGMLEWRVQMAVADDARGPAVTHAVHTEPNSAAMQTAKRAEMPETVEPRRSAPVEEDPNYYASLENEQPEHRQANPQGVREAVTREQDRTATQRAEEATPDTAAMAGAPQDKVRRPAAEPDGPSHVTSGAKSGTRDEAEAPRPAPGAPASAAPSAPPAPGVATTAGAAPDVRPSVMSAIGARMATWNDTMRKSADDRRIRELHEKVQRNALAVTQGADNLRGAAPQLFTEMERVAKQEGVAVSQVVAEMKEGGKHAGLRRAFEQKLTGDPPFAAAYDKLQHAGQDLLKSVRNLGVEGANRGLMETAPVKDGEETAARAAMKLDDVPGRSEGKTLFAEIGAAAERVAERIRGFFNRLRGETQERSRDSAPSRDI